MKFLLQGLVLLTLFINGSPLLFALQLAPKSKIDNRLLAQQNFSPNDDVVAARRSRPIVNFFKTSTSLTESTLKFIGVNTTLKILSNDPLIYIIPSFLSPEECDSYRQYVYEQCNTHSGRNLTRSNPPEISLDVKKLWPLPFLSLMSGIPRYLHRLNHVTTGTDTVSFRDIVVTVLPVIFVTLIAMGLLGFVIILPILRKMSETSSRTSDAIALNMEHDLDFIGPLVDRATACVWTSHINRSFCWENWEAPVVTRYDNGSIFARHGDASPTRGNEWKHDGGQRLVTCICYLNTLNKGQGGGTYFDKLNLCVQPQQGTALFFYPANAVSMEADERMTHESLPPLEEKWIVQLFGRVECVPPPLGLPNNASSKLN